MMADNYEISFSQNDQIITRAHAGDTIDVTLYTTGLQSQQEREITNFNKDISQTIVLTGAYYLQNSLTNGVDPPGSSPIQNNFLKAFEVRNNTRVSLTFEIKFQIVLAAAPPFDAIVKCKSSKFQIKWPDDATQLRPNKEKEFGLTVGRSMSLPSTGFKPEYIALVAVMLSTLLFFIVCLSCTITRRDKSQPASSTTTSNRSVQRVNHAENKSRNAYMGSITGRPENNFR